MNHKSLVVLTNSGVEVKEEIDDTEKEVSEECFLVNDQIETSLLVETSRDPLDILVLKTEAPSYQKQNKKPEVDTRKISTKTELFRCEICKEIFFIKSDFFRHRYSHTYDAKFTCLICNYVFKTKLGIVDHILVFHKNFLPFGCIICRTRFATKDELKAHRLKHDNDQAHLFKCGLCSLRFGTRTILNTHKMTHSIKRSIVCDICHRECASIVALANHRRSHELIKCDKCPKLFDRNNLNRHKKKVHSIGLIKCDICSETFDDDTSLNTHKFSHIGILNIFKCTVCCKKFDNVKKRNKHELIHNKEKIYECEKCQKRYQYFSQLQKHYRDHPDHTDNKEVNKDKDYHPIECNICHKRYTQHMGLRNHIKTHTKQKDYNCDICYKRFYTKYVLRDHLRVHTGEKPFECKFCPKKFRTGTNLNYHLATHSKDKKFECATCDKEYSRKGKLMEHIRKIHCINNDNKGVDSNIHHKRVKINLGNNRTTTKIRSKNNSVRDPQFQCAVCKRQFKLKHSLLLHKIVHAKEDYECDMCYKKFDGKLDLEMHKKYHPIKAVNKDDFLRKKAQEVHSYTLICNNIMTTVINPMSTKKKRKMK